jgi:hypothetical protein
MSALSAIDVGGGTTAGKSGGVHGRIPCRLRASSIFRHARGHVAPEGQHHEHTIPVASMSQDTGRDQRGRVPPVATHGAATSGPVAAGLDHKIAGRILLDTGAQCGALGGSQLSGGGLRGVHAGLCCT